MKIVLLRPPFYSVQGKWLGSLFSDMHFSEPLSILYLASVLKKDGHDVEIVDGEVIGDYIIKNIRFGYKSAYRNISKIFGNSGHRLWKNISSSILSLDPDVICSTTETSSMSGVIHICKNIRQETEDPIILGGSHVTALPQSSLEETDANVVVVGEGEKAIVDVVNKNKTWLKGKHVVGPYSPITDLDTIPWPSRSLLPNSPYDRHIITMRGCPHDCLFCASKSTWGRTIRLRSPKNVVNEIEAIHKSFNTKYFRFSDDTFSIKKDYTLKLCDLLAKRNMDIEFSCNVRADSIDNDIARVLKKAKCRRVTLGAESANEGILNYLKKGTDKELLKKSAKILNDWDLDPNFYFMINTPVETLETIRETENLIDQLDIKPQFSMLTPLPGTELWEIYQKQNPEPRAWYEYFCVGKPIMNGKLSAETLYSEYLRLNKKYMKKGSIGRFLDV